MRSGRTRHLAVLAAGLVVIEGEVVLFSYATGQLRPFDGLFDTVPHARPVAGNEGRSAGDGQASRAGVDPLRWTP